MKHTITTVALCGILALGAHASQAASFQTLYRFTGGMDGATPIGALIMTNSGLFYGTTFSGGVNGGGTIFSFDPASDTLSTLYAFSKTGPSGYGPIGALLPGGGSKLYGVTQLGGGTDCTNVCGTVFQFDTVKHKLKALHAFTGHGDGGEPSAKLTFDPTRAILYGTTRLGGDRVDCNNGCGTVFKVAIATATLTTLYQFNSDGLPTTGLTFGSDGLLYGTAEVGGAHGSGTLFKIDPGTGIQTDLHDFEYHVDGSGPLGDLASKQGIFYGSTSAGGATGGVDGTVYSYNPATQSFLTLHNLDGAHDGEGPQGPMLAGKHNLIYGTATQGGAGTEGTVFSVNAHTLAFTIVYSFTGGTDGALPQTGVIQDQSGALYGVTSYQNGTIFKIVP